MTTNTSRAVTSGRANSANVGRHIPGELGIWLFVFADMTLEFATIFGYFLWKRGADPVVFAESRATLNSGLGLINTLFLLTSSLFVVLAVQALRSDDRDSAATLFTWARAMGICFVLVKVFEYSVKLMAGHTPTTNPFYMYYFATTGLHLCHVVIGLAFLGYVARGARAALPRANELRSAEVVAAFWHMVDLVWIILFPLFYLVS